MSTEPSSSAQATSTTVQTHEDTLPQSGSQRQQTGGYSADSQDGQKSVAESELRFLQLKLERAKLEDELNRLSRPWWRSWNVTALGALLAATAPATTAVQGYFEKMKLLALAEQKQTHENELAKEKQKFDLELAKEKQMEEVRNRYLDRMKNPDERRRTLRFLGATSHNPDIQTWIALERPILEQEVSRLETEAEVADSKAILAERAYKDVLAKNAVAYEKFLADQAKQAREKAEEKRAVSRTSKNSGDGFIPGIF